MLLSYVLSLPPHLIDLTVLRGRDSFRNLARIARRKARGGWLEEYTDASYVSCVCLCSILQFPLCNVRPWLIAFYEISRNRCAETAVASGTIFGVVMGLSNADWIVEKNGCMPKSSGP